MVKYMNGDLAKQKLKEYILKSKPIMDKILDDERMSAAEFGDIQVGMVDTFQKMIAEGKGIRGFLVNLMYQICGGKEGEKILRTSTFMEFFHTSLLIQDDFMDRDDIRRGLPAVHVTMGQLGEAKKVVIPYKHYGDSVAICLSDTGIYLSWKILLSSGFPLELIMRAAEVYYKYSIRLTYGQVSDLTVSSINTPTEEEILTVIFNKSGEYTSLLPIMVGATLAGEKDPEKLRNIEEYAKCLGWAFHIQDDLLGIFGEQEVLGKPVDSDISEGKKSLLMLHLSQNGTEEQIKFQKSLLGKDNITEEELKRMRNILLEVGSYEYVMNLGKKYVKTGISFIPKITKNKEHQDIMESLITYMMERVK